MSMHRPHSLPRLSAAGLVWIGAFLAVLAPTLALATSTGLNNIPTADTPPDRTVVFQAFTNIGDERQTDYVLGMKMGLRPFDQRLEWGFDGRIGESGEQTVVLQAKYAAQPWPNLPTAAVGVANLAFTSHDRDEVGQPFIFIVASHDFGWLRGHAGYGFQTDNDAAFFGLDKTINVLDRDLMLRFDMIQIDDGDQWLGSAGAIYFLDKHLAVESWISLPFESGEPVFTLKLNFIFPF